MSDLIIEEKTRIYNQKITGAEQKHKKEVTIYNNEKKRIENWERSYMATYNRNYNHWAGKYKSANWWINDYLYNSGSWYQMINKRKYRSYKKSRSYYERKRNQAWAEKLKAEENVKKEKTKLEPLEANINTALFNLTRIKNCKEINIISLPKANAVLSETEKRLEEVKLKAKECKKRYKEHCSENYSRMLNDFREQRVNHNDIINNLEDSYKNNKCTTTINCDSKYEAYKKAETNYTSANNDYHKNKYNYEKCIDPHRNTCRDKLSELKKSQDNVRGNITYMNNIIENFSVGDNIEANNELETIIIDNDNIRKNIKIRNIPINDSIYLVDNEMCKNILLTSAGSVMLYYLFFEN